MLWGTGRSDIRINVNVALITWKVDQAAHVSSIQGFPGGSECFRMRFEGKRREAKCDKSTPTRRWPACGSAQGRGIKHASHYNLHVVDYINGEQRKRPCWTSHS